MIQFSEDHHYELVLDIHEVVRLLGICSDKEDYYWIVVDFRGQYKYLSGCCALYPLKGVLPESQYKYLDYFFKINNVFISDDELKQFHEE